ncbi:RING finger domain protein [Mycena venus]|uniref:RING finger domain protein n=1 Tax=Mycena venus TaxID=2733690 RepID=A0A8H6XW34_9AGAR|nr:RING finger domain protein [Mycena venus]
MASNQSLNLNHLLNFTLPPRQTQPPPSLPRRSRKTATHQGVWNKERFVNAQYRFVMNPNGDYTVHFADPDIFFQWQDILQVIIPRSSALASAAASGERTGQDEGHTTCPICLSPPTAPRMTKCGHVFCFPCILHYFNTSENKWARCPICFDSVNEKQLKSVKWFDGPLHVEEDTDGPPVAGSSSSGSVLDTVFETAPRAGSTMRMRLMQRPQITTLALPRSHTWPSDLLPPHQAPFHFLPDVFDYAKFMLATPSYLVTDLTQDLNELASERRILSGMTDDLSVLFIDAADAKVRHQIEKAEALESSFLRERIDKAIRDQREIQECVAFHANRRIPSTAIRWDSSLRARAAARSVWRPSSRQPQQSPSTSERQPASAVYVDVLLLPGGLRPPHLFLHPLDIKILLSHFSSYPAFPDAITVRVDAFSEGTVNDATCESGASTSRTCARRRGRRVCGGGPRGRRRRRRRGGSRTLRVRWKMRGCTGGKRKVGRMSGRGRVRRREKREKDRDVFNTAAATTWRFTGESPVLDEVIVPAQPAPLDAPAGGAWGARSFAAALHSAPTTSQGRSGQPAARRQEAEEDEWDMDAAWHELETKSGGGKKRNKLVVLGSGGGGRRRR